MNADRERPVDVADAMSVGGDDGDEGDDGRERQQTSDVAVGDGVEPVSYTHLTLPTILRV